MSKLTGLRSTWADERESLIWGHFHIRRCTQREKANGLISKLLFTSARIVVMDLQNTPRMRSCRIMGSHTIVNLISLCSTIHHSFIHCFLIALSPIHAQRSSPIVPGQSTGKLSRSLYLCIKS